MSGVVVLLQTLLKPSSGKSRTTVLEGNTDPVAYEWLRLGVRAALDGNREDARYYFVQAVRTDLNFGRGWLYLGGVADDPALTLSCLRKALQLDPGNPYIHVGILWAREKLGLIQPVPLPPGFVRAGEAPQMIFGLPAPATRQQQAPTTAPIGAVIGQQPTLIPPPPTPQVQPQQAARVQFTPIPAQPEPQPRSSRQADPGRVEPPPLLRAKDLAPEPGEEYMDGTTRLVRRGVRAAVAGNRPRARYFFLKAIAADTSNTRAWLYFGGLADDPSTTLACMERVLQTEPHSADAQAGVQWALSRLGVNGPMIRWWRT